jgi:Na+/phosphate symporter|tara:strand:+ start:4911 stop:5300 length:390 start_codon:yes stop_codon:yes gene_type:complete
MEKTKECSICKKDVAENIETCWDCSIAEIKKDKSPTGYLAYIGLALIIYTVYSFFDKYFVAIDKNQITNSEAFAIFLGEKFIYYIPAIYLIIFSFKKSKRRTLIVKYFTTFIVLSIIAILTILSYTYQK